MEYFNLNEATVTVTTQLMLDMETDRCFGMTLSDYGDMDEFRCRRGTAVQVCQLGEHPRHAHYKGMAVSQLL